MFKYFILFWGLSQIIEFFDLQNLFLVLFSCLAAASTLNGYKILFMAPFNQKSHFLYCQSFVKELLNRGHEVTFITSSSLTELNLKNYTEVLIDPPFDFTALSMYSQIVCNFQEIKMVIVGILFIIQCHKTSYSEEKTWIHLRRFQFR